MGFEGGIVKCLDVGCGRNKTSGCIGVDSVALNEVDIVHDLSSMPWPFADSEFDLVYSNHYLEHSVDIVGTFGELHRILKPNAELMIRVPHYASDNFHSDLTHRNAFGWRSMDHFSINSSVDYNYYTKFKFEIIEREIRFVGPGRFDPFQLVGIKYLANRFPRIYERFFVYWLPPTELFFRMRAVK